VNYYGYVLRRFVGNLRFTKKNREIINHQQISYCFGTRKLRDRSQKLRSGYWAKIF